MQSLYISPEMLKTEQTDRRKITLYLGETFFVEKSNLSEYHGGTEKLLKLLTLSSRCIDHANRENATSFMNIYVLLMGEMVFCCWIGKLLKISGDIFYRAANAADLLKYRPQ
ncbi:MAG: hypothetical protein Q4G69_14110 [Planctomycetia bacterium]|nr:hypothetical protein [Planctomycetia bacterium]